VSQQRGVIIGRYRTQDQAFGAQDVIHDRHSTGRAERVR
jgi:hypothetical protein